MLVNVFEYYARGPHISRLQGADRLLPISALEEVEKVHPNNLFRTSSVPIRLSRGICVILVSFH